MNVKYFNKIPFVLYNITATKKSANSVAEKIRGQGYYVRLIGTKRGVEIWVSLNPRWFYRFGRW